MTTLQRQLSEESDSSNSSQLESKQTELERFTIILESLPKNIVHEGNDMQHMMACKDSLTRAHIDHATWEPLTADRTTWRNRIVVGVKAHEADILAEMEEKRQRRKQPQPDPSPNSAHTCNLCGRRCKSRIGLLSHTKSCRTRV